MENQKFNPWWVFGGLLVVAMVVLALVLNFNYNTGTNIDTDTIDIDNGDTKIDWKAYPSYDVELSGNYDITAPGTYYITGSTTSGGVSVKLNDNGVARLVLKNTSIKNPSGPAIACYSGDDLVIELEGSNHLEDGASYSGLDEDVKGAIYSKADLTLQGSGSLTLISNYQDGIVSKDDLKINGGTYTITSADDGIRGKDSVYIIDGKIEISAKGDGIKSTNDKENTKGFVLISGGEINITKSSEGIEARLVIVDDGDVSIFANDDGINATGGSSDNTTSKQPGAMDVDENSAITINGGKVYINAAGDGVDSNGYIYINGGSLIVDGPTNSGNGALDAGISIAMNGGTAVAVGASGMAESLGNASSIYNVSIFFDFTLAKDTTIEIKNSDGETIISHTSAKSFAHMAAGSAKFKPGETYTIYVDDANYTQFTISEIVTTVGDGGHNTPGGGAPGNGTPPGRMR